MADYAGSLYEKYVPRWVKVIRWREWGRRIEYRQKTYLAFLYIPAFITYQCGLGDNSLALKLLFNKPQTEEELIALKRNNLNVDNHRSWAYGQYNQNMPPLYDLSERRLKYPQYYKGRYDGYKKDLQIDDGTGTWSQDKVQKFATV